MTLFVSIAVVAISVVSVVGVIAALVWAAKKDGADDEARQDETGVHRETRIGH